LDQNPYGGDPIPPTLEKKLKKSTKIVKVKKATSKKLIVEMKELLIPLIIMQTIIMLLLVLVLIFMGFNLFSEGAVIDAGSGIKPEVESIGDNVTQYNVKLQLNNTGDITAKVNIAGETYVSKMGTAWGEEVWSVLDNKYIEIAPGESKTVNLGSLKTYEGWHYVIKVHISWNGGSLELTDILVP
jgi:hypothetical protein